VNKIYVFLVLLAAFAFVSAVNNPSNPPVEITGAPGEATCALSGCHRGGNFTGTVKLEGIPDTILAGQTYKITIRTTTTAGRTGFEATAIDGDQARAGTFMAGTGSTTAIGRTFGRQYIRHAPSKLTRNGETTWDFDWTAPSAIKGDSVSFYFVSLAANNNGSETGDNVLAGKMSRFFMQMTSSTEDATDASPLLYPNPVSTELRLGNLDATKNRLFVYNDQGQQVLHKNVSSGEVISLHSWTNGVYHYLLQSGKKSYTGQFIKY